MKRLQLTCLTALCLACLVAGAQKKDAKYASQKDQKTKWVVVDSATAMKNWVEYMTPGYAHQMLASADGEWIGEMTMWMEKGGEPMKSTTTATNKMIMGGRYQVSTHKGDFGGMPFEGMSTVAYDNAKKVYISTWIDNMGTGVMTMEGKWDDASRSILFKGKMICPSNGVECDVREIFRIVDENTQVMEMYGPDPNTGKEFKNMEIKFIRKK